MIKGERERAERSIKFDVPSVLIFGRATRQKEQFPIRRKSYALDYRADTFDNVGFRVRFCRPEPGQPRTCSTCRRGHRAYRSIGKRAKALVLIKHSCGGETGNGLLFSSRNSSAPSPATQQ